MKSKYILLLTLLVSASYNSLYGQLPEELSFGFEISTGATKANIKDELTSPSRVSVTDDGTTSIEVNNLAGRTIKFMAHYALKEQYSFSSGLYFGKRRLNVLNVDGSYRGTSVYHVDYLHLPLLVRYESNELTDKLKFVASAGTTIDFRTKEEAQGSDYSHFMNLANNRFDLDPQRSRNGKNKAVKLFNGLGASLYLSAGVDYQLTDMISAHAGLSYHQGLTNILNRKLLYNDPSKTRITKTAKWRTGLIAFDFGVGFKL